MRFGRSEHRVGLTLRIGAAAVFGVLLLGTTAVAAQARPAAPGPGNSAAAHACQNGGWQSLVTAAGATFASQDECVAYAAQGGVLKPKPTATFVLDIGTCVPDALDSTLLICSPVTAAASGLQPGAIVYQCYVGQECGSISDLFGPVRTDGTFQLNSFVYCPPGFAFYFESTTASGAAIDSNTVTCSVTS